MQLGMIGLGRMGANMVRRLLKAGHDADVFDNSSKAVAELVAYAAKYPELAIEINQMQRPELPVGWDRNLPVFATDQKGLAGREASGKVLNVLAQNIPWFLGGSAGLGPSNKTTLKYKGAGDFQADNPSGKNLHFGIREHAMAAIVNG